MLTGGLTRSVILALYRPPRHIEPTPGGANRKWAFSMTFERLSRVLLPIGLVVLAVGAATAALVQRGRGRTAPGFPYGRSQLSARDYAALASRPGWKPAEVPAGDGLTLRGLVRPPRDPRAPWVLFFQGNSNRLLGEGQAFLEALAGPDDLGLALVAWRGFDGSPGDPTRQALLGDAAATVRWLREHGAAGSPLHLVGFSLGTMPAVAAALEAQRGPDRAPGGSLTLLAPFTTLRMYEAGPLRRWLTLEDWALLPLLDGLAGPVLVVHGTADQTLPVEMGREVARRCPRGRLVELSGAGHLDLLEDPRTFAALRALR
jgi:pimeloyl-ACP methyl ester carboxylesterase